HVLFGDVDGRFPNHHPDPTEEKNLVDIRKAVAERRADLGVAFDGDGDRIGVVDGQGRVVWGDQILLMLARSVLADRPGATIIADVKASQALFDGVAALGGDPLMWKTGHSLIKAKMKETGAPLAGEMSGHVFFADKYYGFDDALYAAVRLLDGLAGARTEDPTASIAGWRDAMPSPANTPELRFDCPDTEKFAVVERLAAHLAAEGAAVSDVDGVRVRVADGWWLLRASNTQPVLVARCEAADEAGLDRVKAALRGALSAVDGPVPTAL
ncbi:MAG: phosphomannomutase/phosphoglucomutase, partial [Pseudomonadota bacterium]